MKIDVERLREDLIDYYDLSFVDDYYYTFIKYIFNGNDLFINYDEIICTLFMDDSDNNKLNREKIKFVITNICMILENYLYSGNNNLNFLEKISTNKIVFVINCCYDSLLNLNYNVNMKLWLDSLFSRLIGGLYD